jgi:hypothetical protein
MVGAKRGEMDKRRGWGEENRDQGLEKDSQGARVVTKGLVLMRVVETRRFALDGCLLMKGRKVAE